MRPIGNGNYSHKGFSVERIESEGYGKSYFFYGRDDRALEVDPASIVEEAKEIIDQLADEADNG